MINKDVIDECKNLSFPDAIKRLSEIAIERYSVDFIRMEKIFYSREGDCYVDHLSIDNMPKISINFNESKLIESLRSIQQGNIDYNTFVKNIAMAGTINYIVYIDGKQVIYFGRKGETYIEKFPF